MPYNVGQYRTGPQNQALVTGYGSIVVLTAFAYDWMLSISEEVASVQKTRLNMPIVAYYLSRLCCLAYCFCILLTNLALVADNEQVEIVKFAVWWVASAATSLLFFFRVRAVYKHCRAVRIMFSFIWIIIIVSPTAMLYSLSPRCRHNLEAGCKYNGVLSLLSNGTIFINDTLVFVLVSRQLYQNSAMHQRGSYTHRMGLFLRGKGLYNVSQSLLQSGELYYGVTIGFQLASCITYVLSVPYSPLVGLIYIALSSSMACRVFRMVLLSKTVVDVLNTEDIARAMNFSSAGNEEMGVLSRERGDLIPLT